MRRIAFLAAGLAAVAHVCLPSPARAGGLELPDNGTQALGRGGAFTAKADDGTAVQYNVAGFARQRGTRLLLNTNVLFQDYQFQRFGAYPDNARDPATPWGGSLYPAIANQGAPFVAPFGVFSTDLGSDRFTLALAAFGPSAAGNKVYPRAVAAGSGVGVPSPSRYDVVQPNSTVILPTVAAAYRATKELDLGVALHAVYGSFDLTTVSYADISADVCKNAEYQPCDSLNRIQTTGWGYAASVGAMWRPDSWIALGLNVRTPFSIDSSGTASVLSPPRALPQQVDPAPATFSIKFPLVVRAGLRFIFMDGAFEAGDLEVDGTYEGWSGAQGEGPKVDIPQLSIFKDIHTTVAHGYGDTYSVRAGAAYNWHGWGGVLTLRGGGYFDSSATSAAFTRMDFDTREKYAATVGFGYQVGGVTVNLGYAEVFSPDRVVQDGVIRPINGAKNGSSVGADGNLLPAVNNGIYSGHTRILSAGIELRFDMLFGKRRHVEYGDDYEAVDKPPPPPPPKKEIPEHPAGEHPAGEET